jgi:hypothetical protein
VDGSQSLMQLPHVDVNHVKKLNRSKIRYGLQPHSVWLSCVVQADACRDLMSHHRAAPNAEQERV